MGYFYRFFATLPTAGAANCRKTEKVPESLVFFRGKRVYSSFWDVVWRDRGLARARDCIGMSGLASSDRGDLTMMSSARCLPGSRHNFSRKNRQRKLFLEALEDRSVPSIIFNGASTAS